MLQSYDITSFEKDQERKVLQALPVILRKKTQIEADEAMMRMNYNIIKEHVCYDFSIFISNEMRRNIFKIEKSDFWHSSYLWWMLVHQNLEKFMEVGLQVELATLTIGPTSIDLRVPILTKLHKLYYDFMYKFYASMVEILIGKPPNRLRQTTIRELEGGNNISDQYLLKDQTIIIRYGYFEKLFFLPKFVTTQLYFIEMGSQMCAIETKYGSEGNFKPIVNISAIIENFTLLEIGYKDSIVEFITQNFKLEMVDSPWMYYPPREITKNVKSNKKRLAFSHEPRPHVEYFINQTEQEAKESSKCKFGTLNKSWLTLEHINK